MGLLGFHEVFDGMAGDAGEETGDAVVEDGGIGRKMHSVGSAGDGDVRPGVDEDLRWPIGADDERATDKRGEFASGKIFLADLDVFDPLRDVAGDALKKRVDTAELFAVRDEIADHRGW